MLRLDNHLHNKPSHTQRTSDLPTEQVMIVSGSAKVEMKDTGKTAILGPGGFAMMPSKHVHQFTCTSACSAFVSSNGTDRKSTRLNSSHLGISYAVFCLKKKSKL